MAKRKIDEEINMFFELWPGSQMISFLRDIIPLFEMFDIDDENDWILQAVGKDDELQVKILRTVYLISRIAEFHAGKLCQVKTHHKGLWERMEKIANETRPKK
jgi:hypothetical protein